MKAAATSNYEELYHQQQVHSSRLNSVIAELREEREQLKGLLRRWYARVIATPPFEEPQMHFRVSSAMFLPGCTFINLVQLTKRAIEDPAETP